MTTTGIESSSVRCDRLEPRRMLSAPVPTNVAAVIDYRQAPDLATNVARVMWADVEGEDGYRVEFSADGTSGWQALGTDTAAGVVEARQVLDAGQKYYYRVRSLSGGVPSEPSTVVSPITPLDGVVTIEAVDSISPPSIELRWPAQANATSYQVWRKGRHEEFWTELTDPALPGSATGYTDFDVARGGAFEYRVVRRNGEPLPQYGYVYAGIEVPAVHDRGRVLLVVDQTQAAALDAELARLRDDLRGEGWRVERIDVPRDDDDPHVRRNVTRVKGMIQEVHDADPAGLASILIIGHVPVPYSGILTAFDGHFDHNGAWAADAYYGEMDGIWTDVGVPEGASGVQEVTWARFPENNNRVGDGKFDQAYVPSDVDVPVGRVDFSRLGWPAWSETDLLARYLDKNHAHRRGQVTYARRALIDNHLGLDLGVENGWRGFAPLVGAANLHARDWQTHLQAESYLWAYGAGPGDFWSAHGIGWAGDYNQNQPYHAAFKMLFGTWFGDWDKHSSFLRNALASNGEALAVVWGGFPNWFPHPLGLGESLGDVVLQTQNQRSNGAYQPAGIATRGVHVALLGDPTLRQEVQPPPASLSAVLDAPSGVATLSWPAAPDALGYYVYRADDPDGAYQLLTPEPVAAAPFVDGQAGGAWRSYMVRAVGLERNPSGSHFNLSAGAVADVGASPPVVNDARFLCYSSHAVRWRFSEDVSATFSLDDLTLLNVSTGQLVPSGTLSLEHHPSTRTATLRFPGSPGARLPDGRYRATLAAAGITDAAGNPLPADHVLDFFVLGGDANHDGFVNLIDFNILAARFGTATQNYREADFNYDGVVNLADFNILAANFGASGAASAGAPTWHETPDDVPDLEALLNGPTDPARAPREVRGANNFVRSHPSSRTT